MWFFFIVGGCDLVYYFEDLESDLLYGFNDGLIEWNYMTDINPHYVEQVNDYVDSGAEKVQEFTKSQLDNVRKKQHVPSKINYKIEKKEHPKLVEKIKHNILDFKSISHARSDEKKDENKKKKTKKMHKATNKKVPKKNTGISQNMEKFLRSDIILGICLTAGIIAVVFLTVFFCIKFFKRTFEDRNGISYYRSLTRPQLGAENINNDPKLQTAIRYG